jgi:peptidoglycan-N-acetylglucosamine deacetylase
VILAWIVAVVILAAVAYFSPWLWRRYREIGLRSQIAKKRILILTYDDGPSARATPQLLDLLKSRNANATFFMLGRNAQQHPTIVDRVLQEGHDVACHSSQHLNAWKVLPKKAVADIRAGYDQLSRWIQPNSMFRPPYGKMTLPTYWELRQRKAPVWWWTVDSGDTNSVLPQPASIVDAVRKNGGGIVLMHDLERTPQRTQYVLDLTTALLDVAKQESLRVVPLRELQQ